MPKTKTVKQISSILQKANLSITDAVTKAEITSHILEHLYRLIKSEETEKNFIKEIEIIRFSQIIDEFLAECNTTDSKFEFFIQHKKEIIKNNEKALVFQQKFKVIDLDEFKAELKKLIWYSAEFYNEELRRSILENQRFECALCGKDISESSPHLHHIDYNKSNCKEENLIFLCIRCHGKSNSNREFWKNMLTERKREKETKEKKQ